MADTKSGKSIDFPTAPVKNVVKGDHLGPSTGKSGK